MMGRLRFATLFMVGVFGLVGISNALGADDQPKRTTYTETTVKATVTTIKPAYVATRTGDIERRADEARKAIAERKADAQRRATTPGPDLDCADIGLIVDVSDGDPHHLDGDGDGWGCN